MQRLDLVLVFGLAVGVACDLPPPKDTAGGEGADVGGEVSEGPGNEGPISYGSFEEGEVGGLSQTSTTSGAVDETFTATATTSGVFEEESTTSTTSGFEDTSFGEVTAFPGTSEGFEAGYEGGCFAGEVEGGEEEAGGDFTCSVSLLDCTGIQVALDCDFYECSCSVNGQASTSCARTFECNAFFELSAETEEIILGCCGVSVNL